MFLTRYMKKSEVSLDAVKAASGTAAAIMLQRHVIHNFSLMLGLAHTALGALSESVEDCDIVGCCKALRKMDGRLSPLLRTLAAEKDCVARLPQDIDSRYVAPLKEAVDNAGIMAHNLRMAMELSRNFLAESGAALPLAYGCELAIVLEDMCESLSEFSRCLAMDEFSDSDILEKIWLECEFLNHLSRQYAGENYPRDGRCGRATEFYLSLLQYLSVFMKAVRRNVRIMSDFKNNALIYSLG